MELFETGKLVVNASGRDLIKRLSSENQRLKIVLNCNPKFNGRANFNRVSTCGCIEAEIFSRDLRIEDLEKKLGIVRKQKLFSKHL